MAKAQSITTSEGFLAVSEGQPRLNAFWAEPHGDGPFPGLVVIHEISGLNQDIRNIAQRLAEEGYVAVAVDLFSGRSRAVCLARVFYGLLIRPLGNGVVAEVQGALQALRTHAKVNPARTGAIGFCMGGSYALQLACVDEDLRAASIFYAQNPKPLTALANACPIVGSYPGQDFTAKAAQELEARLERYDVPYDIKTYPGARHSFFKQHGRAHDPEAAADAWRRTMSFFETHLRAG
jgi:carboxymethylenebutenolidase